MPLPASSRDAGFNFLATPLNYGARFFNVANGVGNLRIPTLPGRKIPIGLREDDGLQLERTANLIDSPIRRATLVGHRQKHLPTSRLGGLIDHAND